MFKSLLVDRLFTKVDNCLKTNFSVDNTCQYKGLDLLQRNLSHHHTTSMNRTARSFGRPRQGSIQISSVRQNTRREKTLRTPQMSKFSARIPILAQMGRIIYSARMIPFWTFCRHFFPGQTHVIYSGNNFAQKKNSGAEKKKSNGNNLFSPNGTQILAEYQNSGRITKNQTAPKKDMGDKIMGRLRN